MDVMSAHSLLAVQDQADERALQTLDQKVQQPSMNKDRLAKTEKAQDDTECFNPITYREDILIESNQKTLDKSSTQVGFFHG